MWIHASSQQVEHIPGQTGIYYNSVGYIAFSPTKCKVVSYLNLERTKTLWKSTKLYAKKVANSCQTLKNKIGIDIQIVLRSHLIMDQGLSI